VEPDASKAQAETPGERIRRLRLARGLSQRELAAAGVSHAHLSRIETGSRTATIPVLRRLAPTLGVSVEYLETGAPIGEAVSRDLRLADAELQLRLGGDPHEAASAFSGLLREAMAVGDDEVQLRARVGLGLVSAKLGRFADVVRRLSRVVEDPRVTPLTDADVFAALAHAYVEVGRGNEAIGLLERCLEQLRGAGEERAAAVIRFGLYLSSALADTGDLERAQQVTDEAFQLQASADRYSLVRLYWSQARLAAARGESALAGSSIHRAIALLETTEDERHLARARLLAATIALNDDRLDEAGEQLARVETRYRDVLDVQELAILAAEQAKVAARRGHADDAIGLAERALELAAQDAPERGRAEWAFAEASAAAGRINAAEAAFERAHTLLRLEAGLLPGLLRAWARVLRAHGRRADAILVERRLVSGKTRSDAPNR
jgi:transcriptional regulator with XRE-family HTH domain